MWVRLGCGHNARAWGRNRLLSPAHKVKAFGYTCPLLASSKDRSLYHPPSKIYLFHGESSTESLWFRMPNRSLALPGPCHVSITCASCFSLVLTADQGWHSFWLPCSVSAPAPRWQSLPSFPIPQLVEPEGTASWAESRFRNGESDYGSGSGRWFVRCVLCAEVVGQELGGGLFSSPIGFTAVTAAVGSQICAR